MLLEKKIPLRFILNKVKLEILVVIVYSSLIYYIEEDFNLKWMEIPLAVPAILGTAISLLLGFRTNQSYERWWEARIVWGGIVNDSRTLVRQLKTFCEIHKPENEAERKTVHRIALRQVAWCYALGRSLRKNGVLDNLDDYLSAEELQLLSNMDNIPNEILQFHAKDIQVLADNKSINYHQQQQLDDTLVRLCDHMGRCERIKSTVFPATYSMFIHFFLFLFVLILPFGLIESFGIIEILISTAISSAFFLIEKTSMHMQDPFENRPTDTPVTTIARKIEINVFQMLGLPVKDHDFNVNPKGFYLM